MEQSDHDRFISRVILFAFRELREQAKRMEIEERA
jgi:hypothetical protein